MNFTTIPAIHRYTCILCLVKRLTNECRGLFTSFHLYILQKYHPAHNRGYSKWMALRSSSTLGGVHNNSGSTNVKVKISEYKKINKNSKATIHSTPPLFHLCFCSTCPHQGGIQTHRLVVYSGRCCDVCLPGDEADDVLPPDQTECLLLVSNPVPATTSILQLRVECEWVNKAHRSSRLVFIHNFCSSATIFNEAKSKVNLFPEFPFIHS